MRELAYGCGLPYSVHTHDQHHIGLFAEIHFNRISALLDKGGNLISQIAHQFVERGVAVSADPFLQAVDHLQGGIDAHIGFNKGLFYSVEGVIIHPRLTGNGPA